MTGHTPDETGGRPSEAVYVATCSCLCWRVEGTAAELDAVVRRHDDSPWRQHIVTIHPSGPERDADFERARLASLAATEARFGRRRD